jgi:hypothetical protein
MIQFKIPILQQSLNEVSHALAKSTVLIYGINPLYNIGEV